MADRFYTSLPLPLGEFMLEGPEAHHLGAVRRAVPGEQVTLFNGDGHDYRAEILTVDRKRVLLTIHEALEVNHEIGFELVLASAMPKGDRADFLVEKLTELGVTRFIPLVTTRSVVIPTEAKCEKFNRVVIEASKQCGRNRLMRVDPPVKFDVLLTRTDLPETRLLLHTSDTAMSSAPMPSGTGVVVAVGPEGGFTPEEIERAQNRHWRTVCLGPRILRVETACITAAIVIGNAG